MELPPLINQNYCTQLHKRDSTFIMIRQLKKDFEPIVVFTQRTRLIRLTDAQKPSFEEVNSFSKILMFLFLSKNSIKLRFAGPEGRKNIEGLLIIVRGPDMRQYQPSDESGIELSPKANRLGKKIAVHLKSTWSRISLCNQTYTQTLSAASSGIGMDVKTANLLLIIERPEKMSLEKTRSPR